MNESREAKLARLYTRWAYVHLVACRELQSKLSSNVPAMEISVAIDEAISKLCATNANWEAALELERALT